MEILKKECIICGLKPESHIEVIKRCGEILVKNGYVEPAYIEGMIARDANFSVAIGNQIAIPHGENAYKKNIINTGLVVLTYPEGIDWNGETVKLVIAIAAKGEEHMDLLEKVADAFYSEEEVEKTVKTANADGIYNLLKM